MSDSDWGKRSAPWIAGAGAIVFVAFLIYAWVEQAGYNQYSQTQAADYSEYAAKEKQQACIGVAPAESAVCLAKAETEYQLKANAGRRDYSDLIAQRKSALWAMIMGMAALIGMALSFIGVGLVYFTFRETRRTANVAWHIGMAQTRARIVLDGHEVNAPVSIQSIRNRPMIFNVPIKNIGLTAAENITVSGTITAVFDGGNTVSGTIFLRDESRDYLEGQTPVRLGLQTEQQFCDVVADTWVTGTSMSFTAFCSIYFDDLFEGSEAIHFDVRGYGGMQRSGHDFNWHGEIIPESIRREEISKPQEPK